MEELIIGSHVSFKKETQLLGSVEEALSYGANTMMLYTGAPQNTARIPINPDITKKAHELMEKNKIDVNNIIVHAPYIVNPSNPNNLEFSVDFLKQEIKRIEELGLTKMVLHPGSHVTFGLEEGIKNTIDVLNNVLENNTKVTICIETMAGKGSEIGSTFQEIKQILDGVNQKEKIKVCLDTCHINDAGYDLTHFEDVLKEFDDIIGISNLACMHINDSKNPKASHKDRHENFGFGTIGFETLLAIIYHPKLKGIPKILETPYIAITDSSKEKAYPPYKFEIEMIKNKKWNHNLIEDIRAFYR